MAQKERGYKTPEGNITELQPENNKAETYKWAEPETNNPTQTGYKTNLRGDWNEGYIQDKNENTRYYPEALYDDYLTHLEENGFIDENGMINLQNENGENCPTLEQYTQKTYIVEEINEQNDYELGTGNTLRTEPVIGTKGEEQ